MRASNSDLVTAAISAPHDVMPNGGFHGGNEKREKRKKT